MKRKLKSSIIEKQQRIYLSYIIFALQIVFAAIAIRIALIFAGCAGANIDFRQFALLHDGWEYIRLCNAIAHGNLADLSQYNLRFFLGYPMAMIAMGGWVYPEGAGILINISSAAASCILIAAISGKKEYGWWLALVNPSWLIYTSTIMSEGLSVLFTLITLIFLYRKNWFSAIVCAGISAIIRPVGALLILITLYEKYREEKFKKFPAFLLTGTIVPLLYFTFNRLYFGNVLSSVKVYSDKDFYFPFSSLIDISLSKDFFLICLQWVTLIIAVTGAIVLYRKMKAGHEIMRIIFMWQASVIIFYLFLPSSWAFRCLDRFYLSIYPTTLIGIVPFLPKNKYIRYSILFILAIVSFYIAWLWIVNLAKVFPFAERKIP